MDLTENKAKFTHVSMSCWGVGVYRKSDGDYITVEFENAGIKKLSKATVMWISFLVHTMYLS